MEKVNIEKLSDKDIEYLRGEFVKIFDAVWGKVRTIRMGYESYLSKAGYTLRENRRSGLSKAAFIFKKIFTNSTISMATGTDPAYLDNDTSFLMMNYDQRKKYYQKCDMNYLCANVIRDMENGVKRLTESLEKADQKKKNTYISKICENYNLMLDRMVVRPDDKNLDFMVYPILYNLKMINVDEYNRYIAMRKRKMGTGMDINIMQKINDAYLKGCCS